MKYVVLFCCTLACTAALAQKDPCKKVSKSKENGITIFKSPYSKYVEVIKQCKTDTFFGLHLHYFDEYQHFDTHGITIDLEDGTSIRDDHAPIYCRQESSTMVTTNTVSSHSGAYQLQGFFRITDEVYGKMATKKIKAVHMHTTTHEIPAKDAAMVMRYVRCVADAE